MREFKLNQICKLVDKLNQRGFEVDDDRAWVKYEWPCDPTLEAEEIPIDELWRVST